MDALSEVLQAIRLTGAVFLDARFTAPWGVRAQIVAADCRPFLDDPAQLIAYHYVIEGQALVEVAGEPPVVVKAGEAVLLPRNDPHLLASSRNVRPIEADGLIQPAESGGLARIVHGGGGAATRLVCGFLGSDQRNPLIETLPRVLTIDMAGAGEWLESSLRFALGGLGAGRLGESSIISRLSELMFVEAVRRYAATLTDEQRGWLAGMRDPVVGRALALLHGRLSHPWTAEALAREVALSRSAFADRFAALVGMPPKRYLTTWRMEIAKQHLREGRRSVAQVAFAVGYEAEAAFIRAFKRATGAPPATWRKQAQAGGTRS